MRRFIGEGFDVLQAIGGRLDGQRRVSRREPAIPMVGGTTHTDGGRQGLAGGAEEMLRPRTEGRVLEGTALLEARTHQVGGGRMHADLGGHVADDGDLIGDLRGLRQERGDLIACLGGDRRSRTFVGAGLRVEGVDVRHPTRQLDEDDPLGLAEARQAGVRGGPGGFRRRGQFAEEREDAQSEGNLRAPFDERTTGERIAELVGRQEEAHWIKRNSRVLAKAHAKSARLSPSDRPLPAMVISRALGRRER
jgi:hypothetical protein